MSWVVPGSKAGAVASLGTYAAAFGSAWTSPTGNGPPCESPLGEAAGDAAAVVVPTATAPFMPAASWPGMEQMNGSPPAGMATVPVAVCPGSAAIFVPSAKVRSWAMAPVFSNVTS